MTSLKKQLLSLFKEGRSLCSLQVNYFAYTGTGGVVRVEDSFVCFVYNGFLVGPLFKSIVLSIDQRINEVLLDVVFSNNSLKAIHVDVSFENSFDESNPVVVYVGFCLFLRLKLSERVYGHVSENNAGLLSVLSISILYGRAKLKPLVRVVSKLGL